MPGSDRVDAEVRPGDILAGKYRVERVLGAGGMGVVVAAHHIKLDEKVALKFLLPRGTRSDESVARFLREARAAVKIKSEHVARVIDVGELESGAPYMVMEYLEGSDLAAFLQQRGPLPVEQAVDFVLQACEAIADAHVLGIVHRDLKPANLFCIQRSDGSQSIKVLDFGISKVTTPGAAGHDMTRTSALMGSPLYMSPEQMTLSKGVDARTDIWALGVILFELLAGRPPFTAEAVTELAIKVANEPAPSVRAFRRSVPDGLAQVISTCLEKPRDRRFRTVAELAIALGDFAPKHARLSVQRVLGTLRKAGMSDAVLAPTAEAEEPQGGQRAPVAPTVDGTQFQLPALPGTSSVAGTLEEGGTEAMSSRLIPILRGASTTGAVERAPTPPPRRPSRVSPLRWAAGIGLAVALAAAAALVSTRRGTTAASTPRAAASAAPGPVSTVSPAAAGTPSSGPPMASASASSTPAAPGPSASPLVLVAPLGHLSGVSSYRPPAPALTKVDQVLQPVTISATDSTSHMPIPSYTLSISVPSGMNVQPGTTVSTNSQGNAVILPRLGLSTGTATFTVSGATANPVNVHATATAPPSGTIFTIMNATLQSADTPPAQFPVAATMASSAGANLTSDAIGDIYFTDYYYVGRIASDGSLYAITNPAAGGTATGNGGAPSGAGYGFSYYDSSSRAPEGMGFLSPEVLLVGGAVSGMVDGFRQIDFSTNVIDVFAGGGTSTGTNILASTADLSVTTLNQANVLAGVAGGTAYIYAPGYTPQYLSLGSSGVLNAWTVNQGASCGATVAILNRGVSAGTADASGNIYLASTICGTSPNAATWTYGIVKVDTSGNLTHIAGKSHRIGV